MAAKFELYQDSAGEFRWILVAPNGKTLAAGGEGYTSKGSAKAAIESVRKNVAAAKIEQK